MKKQLASPDRRVSSITMHHPLACTHLMYCMYSSSYVCPHTRGSLQVTHGHLQRRTSTAVGTADSLRPQLDQLMAQFSTLNEVGSVDVDNVQLTQLTLHTHTHTHTHVHTHTHTHTHTTHTRTHTTH